MISLRSSPGDSSVFQVYDDGMLIGHIRLTKGQSGNRYQASINRDGQEESVGKGFESPDDALRWIEMHRKELSF